VPGDTSRVSIRGYGEDMETRELRYFVAVAEELHFGRAAARLHMSQPPLSQLVRRLESELGLELFVRTRRRVELSPAGGALLGRARAAVAAADEVAALAADVAGGRAGTLDVGFVGSAAFGILPALVRRFREQAPAVRVALHELPSARQLAALVEGRLDVGFLRAEPSDPRLRHALLAREPLLAAVPDGHPLSAGDEVAVGDLAGEPWVMFPRADGPPFFDLVVALCRAAGFEPRIEQEAVQMPTILNLVAAGLGVSLVPGSLGAAAPPGAVLRPLAADPARVPLVLAWVAGREGPALESFLGLARAAP
jgi:DNA-binding transcriptional LysR family regulator